MSDGSGIVDAGEIFSPLSAPILPSSGYGPNSAHVPNLRGRAPSLPDSASDFPRRWELLDDVELLTLPDPEYLVADLIPRRGCGVLYGPSGATKTTFVAKLCMCVATGRDFFGHPVKHRGSAVCVATEDPSGFKVRLGAAKRAAHLPLDAPIGVYTFPEPINLRDAVSVSDFTRFLQQSDLPRHIELLVVDTYAAATPGASENSSEDTTTAMVHGQLWRDTLQTTVLFVHHTNASGSRERGHSAMRGAADFMLSLTPVDDAIHVECSKQRNGPLFDPLTLKLVPVAGGTGCTLRLASEVIPTNDLTPMQRRRWRSCGTPSARTAPPSRNGSEPARTSPSGRFIGWRRCSPNTGTSGRSARISGSAGGSREQVYGDLHLVADQAGAAEFTAKMAWQ